MFIAMPVCSMCMYLHPYKRKLIIKDMLVIYRRSKNKMSSEKFQVNVSKNKVSKVQIHRGNIYVSKHINYSSNALMCSCTELKSHYHLIKMLCTSFLKAIKTATLLPVKGAKQNNSYKVR